MIAYEAEQQYNEIERERIHQKNIIAAEEKARKLLESAEFEANMSSQQKLAALMRDEDSMMQTRGENIGFIKKFTNRETIKTNTMMQKAASMISGMPSSSFNKISADTISKLNLNEIGDSEDSVTELQAQLKREEDEAKKKEAAQAAATMSLVQKTEVKKEEPAKPQAQAPSQAQK